MEANPVGKALGPPPLAYGLILTVGCLVTPEALSLVQGPAEYGQVGTTLSHALVYWVIPFPTLWDFQWEIKSHSQ